MQKYRYWKENRITISSPLCFKQTKTKSTTSSKLAPNVLIDTRWPREKNSMHNKHVAIFGENICLPIHNIAMSLFDSVSRPGRV